MEGAGAGGPKKKPPFNPDLRFLGYMTVVPMVLGSALMMILVSLLTPPPSQTTLDRYFPRGGTAEPSAESSRPLSTVS
jgi:hypothetical protein